MEYASYHGYSIICNLKKVSIKKYSKEMRVLSVEEQRRLTSVLLKDTDGAKAGTLLSLYTGIRIGELCALRWENVSVDSRVIRVRETMQRIQSPEPSEVNKTKVIITEPKSKCSIREIPLPDYLIDIIRPHIGQPNTFVLTGERRRYMEPRTLQNKFKKYVHESGIEDANFHALRHTFATRCVEAGFEIKSLSEILGHSDVSITLNKYVHSSMELKMNNMKKLNLMV